MRNTVLVDGLPELRRAFADADADTRKFIRTGLVEAAEPVKREAELLASTRIRKNTPRWEQMRLGASSGGAKGVYMVPRYHRRKGTARKNMGGLLMNRAMIPALDRRTENVVEEFDRFLDRLAERFNR